MKKATDKLARAAMAAALTAAMACCAAALPGCGAQEAQQPGSQAAGTAAQASEQDALETCDAVLQVCHGKDCRYYPVACEAGGETSVKMGSIEVGVAKSDSGELTAKVGDAEVAYADGAEGKNKDVTIKWMSKESFEASGASASTSGEAAGGGCQASDCGMRSGGGCTCGKGATEENDKDGNGVADCLEGGSASGK